MSHPLKREVLKCKNVKIANTNNFGAKVFATFLLRKCIPTFYVRKLWAFEVLK